MFFLLFIHPYLLNDATFFCCLCFAASIQWMAGLGKPVGLQLLNVVSDLCAQMNMYALHRIQVECHIFYFGLCSSISTRSSAFPSIFLWLTLFRFLNKIIVVFLFQAKIDAFMEINLMKTDLVLRLFI